MNNDSCLKHLTNLRNILAYLYQNPIDIRRVISDAGLANSMVVLEGKPVNVWHSILTEAKKANCLKQLLEFIISEQEQYHRNPELQHATGEVMQYCLSDEQLNSDLHHIYYEAVEVPIVIAAMTKNEIAQLPKSNVEDIGELRRLQDEWINPNLRNSLFARSKFATLFVEISTRIKSLVYMNTGIAKDLKACYFEERNDWRPVYCNNSIKRIIAEAFDSLNNLNEDYPNAESSRSSNRKFVPSFISTPFFSTDVEVRSKAITQLKIGGILIIDAFSLLHPGLRDKIVNAEIGGNKHTAILIVSPFNATDLPLNKQIVDIFKRKFERAHLRFYKQYDCLCEIDVGNTHNLTRWLIHATSHISERPHSDGPLKGKLQEFKKSRPDDQATGIHYLMNE